MLTIITGFLIRPVMITPEPKGPLDDIALLIKTGAMASRHILLKEKPF